MSALTPGQFRDACPPIAQRASLLAMSTLSFFNNAMPSGMTEEDARKTIVECIISICELVEPPSER